MLDRAIAENTLFADRLLDPSLGARRMSIAAGRILYEPNTEAKSIYVVHRGQVRTYRIGGGEHGRLLEILGAGDWCGEAALARQEHYGEQATAVVSSVVTEIPTDRLLLSLPQEPRLAVELMQQLAKKLAASRADAAGLVFDDCNDRLLKTLVKFSHSAAAAPHPDGVVLRITHQQLAQAVGVARETVSLALTQLRQKHLLRTGRNQLTFNPEALLSFQQGLQHAQPESD